MSRSKMAAAVKFGKHLKELRIHLCQTSPASKGVSILSLAMSLDHKTKLSLEQEGMSLEGGEILDLINTGDFIESQYVPMKKSNPKFPILIRECSGVKPVVYARYEYGQEQCVPLSDKSSSDVLKTIESLSKS